MNPYFQIRRQGTCVKGKLPRTNTIVPGGESTSQGTLKEFSRSNTSVPGDEGGDRLLDFRYHQLFIHMSTESSAGKDAEVLAL